MPYVGFTSSKKKPEKKPSKETLLLRELDEWGREKGGGLGDTIRAAAKHIRSLRGQITQLEYDAKQRELL